MTVRRETLKKIVSMEWDMFTAVNEGEARAPCQEDQISFEGMRTAQFSAWSQDAADSYLSDLESAVTDGRNLVAEKYIHMMRTTEPARYKALLKSITPPTEKTVELAKIISGKMLEQTRVLFDTYPYVSGQGRPLYSTLDFGGNTSIETYQLGELLTYSQATLTALNSHIDSMEKEGISLARVILENTVKFYGFDSLDSAEAATKKRIDAIGIQVSFGCESCRD